MNAPQPNDRSLIETLRFVGERLGTNVAYVHGGRFHFRLDSRWSLAISPDSAGRFRLDVCRGVRDRATMWVRAGDRDRLAELAQSAQAEVETLV